jgi:hypothetical protein
MHLLFQAVLQQEGSAAQTFDTTGLHPLVSAAPGVQTGWLQGHGGLCATVWTSWTQVLSHFVLQQ